MTQGSFERLHLWLVAIERGLAGPSDWIDWAARNVSESAQPDPWICCLATATTREAALAELHACSRDASAAPVAVGGLALSLGLLYARYRRRQLALEQLLREAGDRADRANASAPSCEAYYALLTSLERGARTRGEIEASAARLFEPPFEFACAAFERIGVVLS